MVSSEPPETATEPATATDLMGERWEGKEKRGERVRVSVECFRVLSLKPQMKRSYEPATKLMFADCGCGGFLFDKLMMMVVINLQEERMVL
ncbi:hypothetical protein Hanom_Chr16g01422861 [Helianthus anomalus]